LLIVWEELQSEGKACFRLCWSKGRIGKIAWKVATKESGFLFSSELERERKIGLGREEGRAFTSLIRKIEILSNELRFR